MKRVKLIIAGLLIAVAVSAQSVSQAKWYIERGQYREAALQLRPLADGGNAEAQYLAATLFLEGKGVTQSNEQAVKYATMAAQQGHTDAIELLAECMFTGVGMQADQEKAWQMMTGHPRVLAFKQKHQAEYWSGKGCLEDYADHLYSAGNMEDYDLLVDYIERHEYGGSAQPLLQKAKSGNAWAMARLAMVYFDQGYKETAREWAAKAVSAGSAYGKEVQKRVVYEPIIYDKPACEKGPRGVTIERVVLEYDKTMVYVHFENFGDYDWICTNRQSHILSGGHKYMILSSSLPFEDVKRITVKRGDSVDFSLTYERIPDNARVVNITSGTWKWTNVTFK